MTFVFYPRSAKAPKVSQCKKATLYCRESARREDYFSLQLRGTERNQNQGEPKLYSKYKSDLDLQFKNKFLELQIGIWRTF